MNAPNNARVIVGIDGSEQALAAVRAAATEAHHRNAPLHRASGTSSRAG